MSETSIVSALLGICLALIGTIYAILQARQSKAETSIGRLGERIGASEAEIATLKSQNARQERDMLELQRQNTSQESTLAGLTQRMIAREDAHAQHREDMGTQFADLKATMAEMSRKLDRVLGSPRTPYPGRYGTGDKPAGGG